VRLGRADPRLQRVGGQASRGGTRHGSTCLQRALIEAAQGAARTKGSYFSAQYARLARRRGPNKAAVAVAHSILETAWHRLSDGELFFSSGSSYFERRHDLAQEAKRLQQRTEALGYTVTITQSAA
jgi:transposase